MNKLIKKIKTILNRKREEKEEKQRRREKGGVRGKRKC